MVKRVFITSDSSASTYSPYSTRLFSVVVRCVGSGFHILPFSASYTLMSKNRSWYMIAVRTWLKVGSNSAIDRSTTIILYLLSFRGAAIKETCASTMSPMRNIWGFTVSTLMMTVSIVICALVCAFRTFAAPRIVLTYPIIVHLVFFTVQELTIFQGFKDATRIYQR